MRFGLLVTACLFLTVARWAADLLLGPPIRRRFLKPLRLRNRVLPYRI